MLTDNREGFFIVSLQDAKEQYDRAEEFVKVIEDFLKAE